MIQRSLLSSFLSFIQIVVSSIGTVAMDLKEECGRSDNLIVETWSASGKFDRVQVCQNKVSMKKPGNLLEFWRIDQVFFISLAE